MPDNSQRPTTVLLVAEAVTLAHFGRIVTLAKSLDPRRYRVIVACDPRYAHLDRSQAYEKVPVHSVSPAQFARALAAGKPVYDVKTLTGYVEEDLRLLHDLAPDLVVGDFRLSLAVSAPLRRVPYAAVVNAYWSPYARIRYPVPDIALTRILGVSLAQRVFDLVRPVAFALHAAPLNTVRRRFGLPSLGNDLRRVYTWGDYTLYADLPEAVPLNGMPANHRFIGPVFWSTSHALPAWWADLPPSRPVILVTLGSSGDQSLLPDILQALASLPVTVIAATTGKNSPMNPASNVFLTDYLPMDAAVSRAQLVVCNGGSLTTYQALAAGVPVIGVCSNMDQLLNMAALESHGTGTAFRAARTKGSDISRAAQALLNGQQPSEAALHMKQTLAAFDTAERFGTFVAEVCAAKGGVP
ncbi:MAG: glycosyltransferase [Burkholderiales bacterium]